MDRQTLRKNMREKRRSICTFDARCMSQAIWIRLFQHPLYQQANKLLIYASALENEVHTSGIMDEALQRQAEVYVPVLQPPDKSLLVCRLRSLADLTPNFMGIPEIAPERREIVPASILDCVLVPGIAFDRQGNRLGFGAGYFDRFLANLDVHKIALAYAFQIIPHIEAQPWDVPVNSIVTENESIDCSF